MNITLDLPALAAGLREAPETLVEQEARNSVSPYLLETILPRLERGECPRLKDIDFDQFELDDPPALVGYLQESSQRKYYLKDLNRRLCGLPPSSTKLRAFL